MYKKDLDLDIYVYIFTVYYLQGRYTTLTLKEFGTFLKYMETENNVKVRLFQSCFLS